MAPILSTSVGVTPQIIDDPELQKLIRTLNEFEPAGLYDRKKPKSSEEVSAPLDIAKLADAIKPHQSWTFEEQVDLHEWIPTLNAIDASLVYFIQKFPSLLLIGPVKRKRGRGSFDARHQPISQPAESLEDVASVAPEVTATISILLRFLSGLLRNASSKSIFNSVEELGDLLAAADDQVAVLALEALRGLATPPCLHKQQSPEVNQHTTGLHSSKTASHRRLIALARGWGTRGSGLGLYTCVTTDDSEFGQGSLPTHAGELAFSFSKNMNMKEACPAEDKGAHDTTAKSDYELVRIHLSSDEIIDDPLQGTGEVEMITSEENDTVMASKKRRKVGPVHSHAKPTKSTAELFFLCLGKAGGRINIKDDRLFALLADIRLAKDFYSNATRVAAVERRLLALITILQAHPSQEIMSGYFQAQPELCVELIDLLRPTVSSANVSAAPSGAIPSDLTASAHQQDALGALAISPSVPYGVRMLAVEALTALVARRDGTSGALTGTARHSSVLNELGVGKGQYLGLLPTLIRYSLASLGSSSNSMEPSDGEKTEGGEATKEMDSLDIGLAFLEATSAPVSPRLEQLERALEFIDAILTLTSAIVSTPTGTSALTDCGLIPALLTTASIDCNVFIEGALPKSPYLESQLRRVKSLLRFITAQAIQILEGAIVTHNNALSAFHDLHGVEVLTSRLSKEVGDTRLRSGKLGKLPERMDCDAFAAPTSDSMEIDFEEDTNNEATSANRILSSQRVLLFSIVTCLTVVFHQESTSSSATAPSGGSQLRKPEFTQAIIDIMDNVESYGGHLASLIATLLQDVLNSDPHVVHHVHKSGIAGSFLNMLLGRKITDETGDETYVPVLPPVPELIMALPNVISALSLTEDGAKAVKDANPFPSLLRLFHTPEYAMPKSRCLLNEMTAIVGTGLDEVMRHVQSLKPLILSAIAEALNEIVVQADELTKAGEGNLIGRELEGKSATALENERSCLMQFVLNFGQLLEQILHNEDHCEPFVSVGGLDALLKLFPAVMPAGHQFLAHVSSLSCPSVSTLHHSTVEESLCLAFKCISMRYDPLKLIRRTMDTVKLHLEQLESTETVLRETTRAQPSQTEAFSAISVLEGLPCKPLHHLSLKDDERLLTVLSNYLRAVSNVQWATSLLGTALKIACQRSQESGPGISRAEREWKKGLSTPEFEVLVGKLSTFHQSAILEVCRIRSSADYEKQERDRLTESSGSNQSVTYRLRIVCAEGAVVRDGIEIDSCASVGSMEMGEIAEAFDRCVNSSGILRYRTERGWVSEMTRGHGREPVAEVISFWHSKPRADIVDADGSCPASSKRRIEAPIPDLRTASAGVLARLQTSYSELFSALSKTVVQAVRSLPASSVSFKDGEAGAHAATVMKILSSNIEKGLNKVGPVLRSQENEMLSRTLSVGPHGVAMYLGSIVSHLHACLFEEKRERRMVNVPLLLYLMESNASGGSEVTVEENTTLLGAIRYILEQSLIDFALRSKGARAASTDKKPVQRIDRTVAASLPPAISLLRRLMSGQMISSSPASSILSRIKKSDLALLLGREINGCGFKKSDNDEALFSPEDFVKSIHLSVSEVAREAWIDPRFTFSPPHIVHPFATLVGEIIAGLEDAGKKRTSRSPRSGLDGSSLDMYRGAQARRRREQNEAALSAAAAVVEAFEPSEDTIARLGEMGFTRDHAIDALESTRSNRLEIAMEYALSHPPPSAAVIERRRVQQEERRRQRQQSRSVTAGAAGAVDDPSVPGGDEAEAEAEAVNEDDSPGNSGSDRVPSNAATARSGDTPAGSNSNQSGSSAEHMDVDNNAGPETANDVSGENKSGKEEVKTEDNEEDDVSRSKTMLKEWIKDAPLVSCDFLAGLPRRNNYAMAGDGGSDEGDGEVEALTVVLCSFLLDICQRFPSERDAIAGTLLDSIEGQIDDTPGGHFHVKASNETSFAALCHALVLFTRALPKTRILVLQRNLVHRILCCVQISLGSKTTSIEADLDLHDGMEHIVWPMWLASSLLILDVMAQPVVVKTNSGGVAKEEVKEDEPKSEFDKVKEDHKQQTADLTDTATRIFSAIQTKSNASLTSPEDRRIGADTKGLLDEDKHNKGTEESNGAGENDPTSTPRTLFAAIPAYFPLMPSDLVQPCMEICIDLLRNGRGASESNSAPPPGAVHASMLLLLRLLRTPKLSTECLQLGAADIILSLPHQCRFTGNSGLVTLILRRLLEDESTLQVAMETEIRGTVTRLHGKRKESEAEVLKAPFAAFSQAITPLLCRDPVSFLKAFMLTVKIETRSEDFVVLLSSEERSEHQRALADVTKAKRVPSTTGSASNSKSSGRRRSTSQSRRGRGSSSAVKSKSPPQKQSSSKRNQSSKKHRREKAEEKHGSQNHHHTIGTPANQIVALLISNVMTSCDNIPGRPFHGNVTAESDPFPDDKAFLWTASLLEVLADLVLAVPACASAVQKFRLTRSKDRCPRSVAATDAVLHALNGCPSPPTTFLSFLLHSILPQDRWSIRNDQQIWERTKEDDSEESEALTARKKRAYRLNKVAQTTARLLVALVARPGEGRKRVVTELAFALSGGRLGHSTTTNVPLQPELSSEAMNVRELHALQAWGELCIGLASPRSSGKSPEGNSSLSFEVIKLMLQLGMAHALFFSVQRVKMHHPMAASVCSSLLMPLEILTRGSVGDGVKTLVDKESVTRASKGNETSKKSHDATTAHAESAETGANDEAMLEEAFHQERLILPAARGVEDADQVIEPEDETDGEDAIMEEDIEDGEEEISGSSESEDSSGEDDDSGESGSEDEDEEDGSIIDNDEDGSDDTSEDMEEVEDGDWNTTYREEAGTADNQEFEDGEDNDPERNDAGLDEGWTRIENSGFGGMLMGGGGRRHFPGNGGPLTARTRGFIDAAEAMIGTLLRTGEIQGDALAEIEGSLGIRIMSNGRSLRTLGGPEGAESVFAESIAARLGGGTGVDNRPSSSRPRGDVVGTLPHVHQRSQPGAGYSALSGGGRWIETSSMEYVYGGPSVTAGSRNYDLLSSMENPPETDMHPNMSQLDLQLFPGGPASAAHARTQHSLHPLLCGVDLPPVNALVSDLLPFGVRCTRRGQMTTRRPGDWTSSSFSSGNCLVLTSNGNIIRSNRSHSGTPLSLVSPSRNVAGPVGWTDDGLPFDSTAAQFSSAFEAALRDSVMAIRRAPVESSPPTATAQTMPSSQRNADDNEHETGGGTHGDGNTDNNGVGEDHPQGDLVIGHLEESQETEVPRGSENQDEEPAAERSREVNVSTDGDRVASSLAEGLRLSPRSDTSVDRMSATESFPTGQQAAAEDAPMEDAASLNVGNRIEATHMDAQPEEDNGADAGVAAAPDHAFPNEAHMDAQPEEDTIEIGGLATGNAPTNASPSEADRSAAVAEAGVEGDREATGTTASNVADGHGASHVGAGVENACNGTAEANQGLQPNSNGLVCPPDIDEEVFNSLPVDMQRDCVEQHRATQELAAQLDSGSSLDPEALAALPEDLRREVMQQEQQERRLREQAAPADPSNAEDMDNASFLASLAPNLREEILLTADETFLNSLPPSIIAEAQILRERAATQHRRLYEEAAMPNRDASGAGMAALQGQHRQIPSREIADGAASGLNRRKSRSGKLRVEKDRDEVVYIPPCSGLTPPISKSDLKTLLRLLYMLSPVRPARLLHKVFQNLCAKQEIRVVLSTVFVKLLHEDDTGALTALDSMSKDYEETGGWRQSIDRMVADLEFPPKYLLGAVPEVVDTEAFNPNITLLRRKQGSSTAASIAANLPTSASGSRNEQQLPPVVATRIVDSLLHLCKNSPRFCLHSLVAEVEATDMAENAMDTTTAFDKLLDLLEKPQVLKSSANLEQLLTLLEGCVSPLSHLSKHAEDRSELSQRDIEAAAASGKEWMDVPCVIVSQSRLQLLCAILRMETCRDASFTKVNTIVRRLCRVEANRGYVLAELASVAHALGADAIRDLKALRIRLDGTVAQQEHRHKLTGGATTDNGDGKLKPDNSRSASSSVTLSTSTSELKLLRVLQTLQALCGESSDEQSGKKNEGGVIVSEELVHLLRAMKLDDLWDELSECLRVVQVLEGVSSFRDEEDPRSGDGESNDDGSGDDATAPDKKLKNSAAGLLTRFLPSIEAFFVANASSTREQKVEKPKSDSSDSNQSVEAETQGSAALAPTDVGGLDKLVGGKRLVSFAAANKVLLNALVRNNPGLLDKGLRGLVQVPRCRVFLDFDVKRQWFKTQVRRLRQHASRRHGSLRLHIRRKHVFEDAYHQLRLRNADEMRGRLHITFRNEEGVDAGGLSREFFGILAKEIFNPDYALFTSTEDGCTFQPNANSNINPDHLSYFRFVGRIVGKAVADGFLLDAHFTRSLYKHMLGLKPTHHDMEAIDPDYYRNLKTILEYKLEDIGLDLTFSIEDHSFGRSQVIDLIENGRNIAVTEERKAEYVSLVCQNRMTVAISNQIKSYLDGFYELVSPELIAIFNPRELELLISGLPDIDVHDLKNNTDYVGWKATDKEIEWFWNVMFSLSRNEKASFLQFVTGSSKVPLAGFSELQGMRGVQKFSIHKTAGTGGALMSAHTCFNSLDLPAYKTEDELREKLLYAINEGGGAFMFA